MIINSCNIYNIRREYTFGKLKRSHLTENPMNLFVKWMNDAYRTNKILDPTAMCLATVDKTGQPFQRLVLLKSFNNETMIFFTNLSSRKAIHLTNNPKISACFPWNFIDRQIIITGYTYLLSKKKAIKYFYERPKVNQISTWVSRQSTIIASKHELEKKFVKFEKKYLYKLIPFPKFWGGYAININSMEFWQGGKYRLHDRFLYKKNHNKWNIYRLSP